MEVITPYNSPNTKRRKKKVINTITRQLDMSEDGLSPSPKKKKVKTPRSLPEGQSILTRTQKIHLPIGVNGDNDSSFVSTTSTDSSAGQSILAVSSRQVTGANNDLLPPSSKKKRRIVADESSMHFDDVSTRSGRRNSGKKSLDPAREIHVDDDEFHVDDVDDDSEIHVDDLEIELESVTPLRDTFADVTRRARLSAARPVRDGRPDDTWTCAVAAARGAPDGEDIVLNGKASPTKKVGKSPRQRKAEPEEAEVHIDDVKSDEVGVKKSQSKAKKILKKVAQKVKDIKDIGKKNGVKRKSSEIYDESVNDGGEIAEKKTKSNNLTRKEKRASRKSMKNKETYNLSIKVKTLWEEIRCRDLKNANFDDKMAELCTLVRGHAKELIFAHDTTRVIQCMIKKGTPDQRSVIFEELRGDILELSKSKYAKFYVRKVLKYGTKSQRNFVFKALYGNVRKLIRHREAAGVLENAYNDYATLQQRNAMVEEFYGPSYALFKTDSAQTLEEIVQSNPEKRDSILSNIKGSLEALIDKSLLQYSLVHRVFLEYFTFGTDKHRTEIIEILRDHVVHMLHTRDGSRVAMFCVWYGSTKDRKAILKSFRSYVGKISREEFGHLVLFSIFDTVDDTKLVSRIILEEVAKDIDDLAKDAYGRKVLLYLLSPRDSKHFHPDIIKILAAGDGNTGSKKENAVRYGELREHISPALLKLLSKNTREFVKSGTTLVLAMAILTHATGDVTEALEAVAGVCGEPFKAGSEDDTHLVEDPAGHLALKRLILADKEKKQGEPKFSQILLRTISKGSLRSWAACNRGCFILITLLELGDFSTTEKVKQEILPIKKSLKKMDFKGASILHALV